MHGKRKNNSECDFDGLKDNKLNYKCRECREIRYNSINGLIKKFPSIYQFCDGDLNKFNLLLRKGVRSTIMIAVKSLMKHTIT